MRLESFQRLRTLRWLTNGAVGAALAACTAFALVNLLGAHNATPFAAYVGLPTLALGTLWTALLRGEKTVGQTQLRVGWLLSVPLAALNAGLACGLLAIENRPDPERFVGGVALGATFGAIIWVPALLATLVCFGLPIARAQRAARAGLAGEERGERQVGATSAVLAVLALLGAANSGWRNATNLGITAALALAGLALGVAATLVADVRERRRRAFVADAAAGKLPNYRVDTTDEGKVLVRVAPAQNYRVADIDEALVELDATGAATRVRAAREPAR